MYLYIIVCSQLVIGNQNYPIIKVKNNISTHLYTVKAENNISTYCEFILLLCTIIIQYLFIMVYLVILEFIK